MGARNEMPPKLELNDEKKKKNINSWRATMAPWGQNSTPHLFESGPPPLFAHGENALTY